MEYDILNDILTMTVDDFFQDDSDRKAQNDSRKVTDPKINNLINPNANSGPGKNMNSAKDSGKGSLNVSVNSKGKADSRGGSDAGVWNLSRQGDSDRDSLNNSTGPFNSKDQIAGEKNSKNYPKGKTDPRKPSQGQANSPGLKKSYQGDGPDLLKNCPVEDWLKVNSPKLLEESLKRLNLDISIIENRNLD